MEPRYFITYDFDHEGEPPKVLICDREEGSFGGSEIMEVFEDPTPINGEWSWEPDNWQPGPMALRVLDLLNGWEP